VEEYRRLDLLLHQFFDRQVPPLAGREETWKTAQFTGTPLGEAGPLDRHYKHPQIKGGSNENISDYLSRSIVRAGKRGN
jgi:hypothetical protein